MVCQIGHISNDIKSRIERLESFAMFEFDASSNAAKEKRSTVGEIVLKTPSHSRDHHHGHGHHHQEGSAKEAEAEEDGQQQQIVKKPKRVTIREGAPDDGVRPCRDFFKALEQERNVKTTRLIKLYDSIGPILIKLESLVLGTFTGECPEMKFYYNHWEKHVFSCFTRFATRNLERFAHDLLQERPLFEVDATLDVPEILMKPSAAEVYGIAINSVTDFLQR